MKCWFTPDPRFVPSSQGNKPSAFRKDFPGPFNHS
jgi:hypothetical protein